MKVRATTWLLMLLSLPLTLRAQKASIQIAPNALLTLERVRFSAAGKKLRFQEQKAADTSPIVADIDGKIVFGTDGELPRFQLAKATLLFNGRQYRLLTDQMYNPWFGTGAAAYPNKRFFKFRRDKGGYILRAMFSDGAGGYVAEWRVIATSATRTILSNDEEFMW